MHTLHRRDWMRGTLATTLAAALPLASTPASAEAAVLSIAGPGKDGMPVRARKAVPAIAALAQRTITTATPWYPGPRSFTGPLLRDVLAAAGVSGRTIRATALNDYRVEIPMDDAQQFDVVLAHLLDGKPMSVREKGPLFVIYPFDSQPRLRNQTYFARCIWQVKALDVV